VFGSVLDVDAQSLFSLVSSSVDVVPDGVLDDLASVLLAAQCSRPVVLPNGVAVRCRSRLKSRCPSCAEQTRGDWAAIARDGVFNVPAGRRFRFYLLTLTAPGIGRVHCVPNAAKGRRARLCWCGRRHSEADAGLSGVPIDLDAYDYDGVVAFNCAFGRLWNNTKTRLRDAWDDLAFFAVREWQDRGVLHLHALIRIEEPGAPTPAELEARATVASARDPLTGRTMVWGRQSRCDALPTNGDGAKSIWYISKVINYANKDIGEKYGADVPPERREHVRRLGDAARRFRCDKLRRDRLGIIGPCDGKHCDASLHDNWGARGQVVTYSRGTRAKDGAVRREGWSFSGLTRRLQREHRLAWVLAQPRRRQTGADFAGAIWARERLPGVKRPTRVATPTPARAP
jgi:hypothetical protein